MAIIRKTTALAALLMALLLPAGALALQDALVARKGLDGFPDYVNAVCAAGDTLWMLGENGVYEYDAQTGEMTAHPFGAEWMDARRGVYDAERGETLYQGVFAWFEWEGEACALVNTTNQRGVIDAGLCRAAFHENGEAYFEWVGPIDWQALESDGYVQIDGCCVVEDVLCACVWQGDSRLCFLPLDGSRATVTDARCWEGMVFPYGGGVAAVDEVWDNGVAYVFNQVEVPSGKMREIARFIPEDGQLSAPAQEPGGDRILFVANGYLTALDPASGEAERIAPMPVDTQQNCGACAVILQGGAYAAGGYDGVAIRQVAGRAASETIELVVGQDATWSEALDEAALTFDRSHPGVTVATVEAGQIVERLLTRSEDIDIFVMHTIYGQEASLMDILQRGYALELDSDVLADYVGGMYPALREAFTRDGRVIAVPLSAQSIGLNVNLAGLRALGLTMEDVPTNWPDFLSFLAGLEGNGRVPVVPFWNDLLNARHPFLLQILKDCQLEMQAGRQTSWDNPQLRAALEALAGVDFEGLIEDAKGLEGKTWEGNPLVNAYESVGINGWNFSEEDKYMGVPLRLSLSAESPIVVPVMCVVAFVNPASRHAAEATALLEEAVDYVDTAQRAMLSPDWGEPARDEAGYQRAVEDVQRQLESLQARVDAGDRAAEGDLANLLDYQARMEDSYWIISQDTLNWYRAHDENIMLETGGELEAMNYTEFTIPAAMDGIDPDALIQTLEKKAQMRRLEGK